MSLENTVAKYEVEITKSGNGAAAAAQEFRGVEQAATQAKNAMQQASVASRASSESMSALKETSRLTKESVRGLTEGVILLGGTKFPELIEATMAARTSMMLTRTVASLFSLSILAAGTAVAGVAAAAIPTAIAAWGAYKARLQEVESEHRLLSQTQFLQEHNLKALNEALDKGVISIEQYTRVQSFLARGTEGSNRAAQQLMQQLGISTEQLAALAKMKKLEEDLNAEVLGSFEQQRLAAKRTYEERVAEIENLSSRSVMAAKDIASANSLATQAYVKKALEIDDQEMQKNIEEVTRTWESVFKPFNDFWDEEQKAAAERGKQYLEAQLNGEKELATVKKQIASDGLTGIAQQRQAADQMYLDEIDKIDELSQTLKMTYDQERDLINEATAAHQRKIEAIDTEKIHLMTMDQMEQNAANSFATGLSQAIVDFATGTKDAKKAFEEFAASFLSQIAQMIIQQEILNAIKAVFFGGGGVSFAASGGTFAPRYAASGIQTVSRATYFPKFNVVAGEAGTEMLTVLAKPRFMDVGGVQAVVGKAGNRTLAITDANQLAQRGGGAGGRIVIELRQSQDAEARIISNSIEGAVIRVTREIQQPSRLRDAAKRASA